MQKAGVRLALASILVCGGCGSSPLPSEGGRTIYDTVHRSITGVDAESRCTTKDTSEGLTFYGRKLARTCRAWNAPRSYHGIFIQEFEGDRFIENAVPALRYVSKRRIWLAFDQKSDASRVPELKAPDGHTKIWHVAFVGRSNHYAGRFGHLGMSDGEVLVDRVISARKLATYDGYLPDGVVTDLNSDNRR